MSSLSVRIIGTVFICLFLNLRNSQFESDVCRSFAVNVILKLSNVLNLSWHGSSLIVFFFYRRLCLTARYSRYQTEPARYNYNWLFDWVKQRILSKQIHRSSLCIVALYFYCHYFIINLLYLRCNTIPGFVPGGEFKLRRKE